MIYGAGLALIAAAAMVNGIDTVQLPAWRQAAFAVLALLAYLYGRRVDFRHGAHLLLVAAALTVPVMVADRGEGVTMFMVLGVFVMLPWFGGRYRRQQVALLQAEQERIARLEREQDLVAERARARSGRGSPRTCTTRSATTWRSSPCGPGPWSCRRTCPSGAGKRRPRCAPARSRPPTGSGSPRDAPRGGRAGRTGRRARAGAGGAGRRGGPGRAAR
nr:hypothetical protein GCM10025732_34930 [Glycomyces mayteni]